MRFVREKRKGSVQGREDRPLVKFTWDKKHDPRNLAVFELFCGHYSTVLFTGIEPLLKSTWR